MNVREGYDKTGDETWPATETITDEQAPEELISPDRLLQYLDASERSGEEGDDDREASSDETGDDMLPRILSMPEGITVDERLVGRAVAQWILQVRCDCGRRWFELEVVDTATCPRCGLLVYVDLDARSNRPGP
jgi:hypothetical protein